MDKNAKRKKWYEVGYEKHKLVGEKRRGFDVMNEKIRSAN